VVHQSIQTGGRVGCHWNRFHWHTTIGSPKVFAIGKNVMMGGEGLNSRKVSGRHTNLIRHGIRFEIDQANAHHGARGAVLGPHRD